VVNIASNINLPRQFNKFSAETNTIGFIAAIICAWFALALLFNLLIPDTSRNSLSALPAYLEYAGRNGTIVLILAALVSPLIIANKSGNLSVINYMRQNISHAPKVLGKLSGLTVFSLLSFAAFMFSYSTIKTRIPSLLPFSWDVTFMKLDHLLFLGRDPWTLFAWVYDYPGLVRFADGLYDTWAGVLVGSWALCFLCYGYKAQVRFRFPLALLLTWFIGGNIFAILLSSAGPCYYAAVTGLSDPYADQLALLALLDAEAPLRAVRYQTILWDTYKSPGLGLGGISAMPSMHCATSFLLVLFAWKRPVLRIIALLFFSIIFVSSFVLAWHYAVDGLLALPIAFFGWHIAGKILNRLSKQAHNV